VRKRIPSSKYRDSFPAILFGGLSRDLESWRGAVGSGEAFLKKVKQLHLQKNLQVKFLNSFSSP